MTSFALLVPFFLLLGLASFVFWVWALVNCLCRSDESFGKPFGTLNPKIVWALIIFFGHFIGALVYLLVAGTAQNPKINVVKVDPATTAEGARILQMIAAGKITPEEGQRMLAALGQKEAQQTTGGASAPTSKGAKNGCAIAAGIVAIILVLLIVFVWWWLPAMSRR